jgi:methylated-DNA-protein-cysteine methyltransferase-like protein
MGIEFMKENFFQKVYIMVKKVPRGKVATYGQIARLCGSPHASRAVGYALHVNPEPGIIPCHRIVNRFGGLASAFAFGGQVVQKRLLEKEGIKVDVNYIVDLNKFKWSN